ncbi:MAG: hypothetical protein FWG18_00900 [Alphaproteobacteria bacterium]|nr:hypothetical protein [Alphaproteobacteria bacterium]
MPNKKHATEKPKKHLWKIIGIIFLVVFISNLFLTAGRMGATRTRTLTLDDGTTITATASNDNLNIDVDGKKYSMKTKDLDLDQFQQILKSVPKDKQVSLKKAVLTIGLVHNAKASHLEFCKEYNQLNKYIRAVDDKFADIITKSESIINDLGKKQDAEKFISFMKNSTADIRMKMMNDDYEEYRAAIADQGDAPSKQDYCDFVEEIADHMAETHYEYWQKSVGGI